MSSRLSPKLAALEFTTRLLPIQAIQRMLEWSTDGMNVAVCLHRVTTEPVPQMLMPELAHTEEQLDMFIKCFLNVPERLVMTFDDGYEDARQFIMTRAPRHRDIRWLFMICPQKTCSREGFPWDAWSAEGRVMEASVFVEHWKAQVAGELEDNLQLAGVADIDWCKLSTAEEVLELAAHPNVKLGNHTNRHLGSSWLSTRELEAEVARSQACFEENFGKANHFAFPFGTSPYVSDRDLDIVRQLVDGTVWTVENRPFPPFSDGVTTVLPRFSWPSSGLSPRAMAVFIALTCVRQRWARRRRSS